MDLNKSFKVTKRNVLNELRSNNMTLQELRFFSIYLSKINPKDVSSRVVHFPLEDFKKIMEFGRLNLKQLEESATSLLSKVIKLNNASGGFDAFQLFKECNLFQDELQRWYIEIDAHDKALPLMFNFQKEFFSYELWNALRLTSPNQLRMYELLKQYEKAGKRTISIKDLKEFLGLKITQYPRWDNFKSRILDSCQVALAENTDIIYTYEPVKVGNRTTGVKFKINKNPRYVDQLTLNEFINLQPDVEEPTEHEYSNDFIELLASACNNEFKEDEIMVLNSLMNDLELDTSTDNFVGERKFLYLQGKYNALNLKAKQTKISNRFTYLKAMIK